VSVEPQATSDLMVDANTFADQTRRLHLAETLVKVSLTVGALAIAPRTSSVRRSARYEGSSSV